MSVRPAWFAYSRPHAGKISAWPVHPAGWALLLGAPLPGVGTALLLPRIAGVDPRIAVAIACLAVLPVTLVLLFRIVVRRGRRVDG